MAFYKNENLVDSKKIPKVALKRAKAVFFKFAILKIAQKVAEYLVHFWKKMCLLDRLKIALSNLVTLASMIIEAVSSNPAPRKQTATALN